MKAAIQSLLISACLLCAVTGQAANVAVSGLPVATTLLQGDDFLVNITNAGLGTYTTKRINAFNLVRSAILSSNRTFQDLLFCPTNTYVPSGVTASGTVGTFLFTLTAGTTVRPNGTNWHTGDNILFSTFGPEQYRITQVLSSTQFTVKQQLKHTYSSAAITLFSPDFVVITDNNNNPHAYIEGDGSYTVDTEAGGLANSGVLGLNAGTNSVAWDISTDAFGHNRTGWEPTGVINQGMPFSMDLGAPGDTLRLLYDGTTDVRALTNVSKGFIAVDVPESYFVPAFATASQTISGTIHGARLTASGSVFVSPVAPGYTIVIGGTDAYVISKIISATVADVDMLLSANYSASAFAILPAHQLYNTITPSPAGFVTQDGSVGVVGENLANAQTALRFSNDTNSFSVRPHLETEGTRLEFYSEQNGQPVFALNEFAPGDSLHVEANGHVGVTYGLTNIHGSTVNVDLALACSNSVSAKQFIATQVNISGSNIDWTAGDKFYKILSASTPFVFSNVADGDEPIIVSITDPSTYVVTWTGVVWPGGTPPTQTVSGHTDIYTFVRMNGTNFGTVVQNF